jgi:hypothetical protein
MASIRTFQYNGRRQVRPPTTSDGDNLRFEGLIHAMAGGVFLIGKGGSVLVSAKDYGTILGPFWGIKIMLYGLQTFTFPMTIYEYQLISLIRPGSETKC